MLRAKTRELGGQQGFALVDLAALIVGLALLTALLLPALARAAKGGQAAVCLNNLRQLSRACQLYTADNRDKFPGAFAGHKAFAPPNDRDAPWAVGWLTWDTSSHNTNTLYISDVRYASLSPYTHGNARLMKCPADRYISGAQAKKGWSQRVRSISSNPYIGTGNVEEIAPFDPMFRHVTKLADLGYPSSSESWLYADEHPDSINDPTLVPPLRSQWVDLPGSYHNGAGSFAFVDGHAELHGWRDGTIRGCFTDKPFTGSEIANSPQRDRDWVRHHTPQFGPAP